ncbi:MAG: endolytic transglycosylase MltG [Myxococcales bacterium]|nr:endolytic transglycosylase MltG [Myxococcales bacterium]
MWLLFVYPFEASGVTRRDLDSPPRVDLRADWTIGQLSRDLERGGVIQNATAFAAYARFLGVASALRDMQVLLHRDMRPREVLTRIAKGYGGDKARVGFPEGFDRFDVAARLDAAEVCDGSEFLALTEDRSVLSKLGIEGTTAEGYLFPDTYEFHLPSAPTAVLSRMVQNFRRRVRSLETEPRNESLRALGWGLPEVVTLASIVELEARAKEEQAVIAGVFVNRMRDPAFRPKRLQADPTVSYGCRAMRPRPASCTDGRITRAMLEDSSNRYNTYRIEGLPPGPIANPGLGALRAAFHPAVHRYFYFVADGTGHHRFSETLSAHNDAVHGAN